MGDLVFNLVVTVAPISPLELIHPDGLARRARVLGGSLPNALQPDSSSERPYDFIVAAPPPGAVTMAWVRDALRFTAAELATDGVAYLLPRRFQRRRLRRLVADHGLSIDLEVAHLPNLASSALLVPLDSAPILFALEELVLLPSWQRRAAKFMLARRRPLSVLLSAIGFVIRRPESRPCFHWLSQLDNGNAARAVIGRTRPRSGPGFFVLHRFSEGDHRPSAVAKLAPVDQGNLDRESSILENIGGTARTAGADVPRVRMTATVGSARVLLLEPVRGHLAATLLAKSPEYLETITADVARWLADWADRTAAPLVLGRELLERALVDPARLLSEHIRGGRGYAESIERFCAAVEGKELVGFSAHNDLTMWNVITREGRRVGVVDWESATANSFPLIDFYYAVADAVAATEEYSDRARSFRTAFVEETRIGRWISALEDSMVGDLGLERWATHLGFHACWLHHASNDLLGADGSERRPFVRMVEIIARQEGRLGQRTPDQSHAR